MLHAFPNPSTESDKFHTWVVNAGLVGEDDDYIFRNRRICRLHFEETYHYPKNRLSKLAVPTLHLPGIEHIFSIFFFYRLLFTDNSFCHKYLNLLNSQINMSPIDGFSDIIWQQPTLGENSLMFSV